MPLIIVGHTAKPTKSWMAKLEEELEQPKLDWPDEEPTIPMKPIKGWDVVEGGPLE